jgi:hypothetical protein
LLKSVNQSFLNFKTINLPVETSMGHGSMEASAPLKKLIGENK